MKDCNYPKCVECDHEKCDMRNNDIAALLKRRRWAHNPKYYRQKQQEYRERVRASLPQCNECEWCILVQNDKGNGSRRLCVNSMRLVEQKVSNSPHWCCLRRKEVKDGI